jgi:hypothetical protein
VNVLIVRQLMTGLLSLLLVTPVSVWHVCRCAHAEQAVAKSAEATPLRPCCAKRMAAAAPRVNDQSPDQIRAKCCCSDLKWNQAVIQVPPTRDAESRWIQSAAVVANLRIFELRLSSRQVDEICAMESRAPDDPLQISLCRWQA